MSATTVANRVDEEGARKGDHAIDAVSQAAHMAHEARMFRTLAKDAVEDGTYVARRAITRMKRRAQDVLDARDDMAFRIKREPLKAVGLAFGAGLLFGALANWAARQRGGCERQ